MYLYYSIHVIYLSSYTERTKIAIVRTAFPGTGPRQSQNETEVKLKKIHVEIALVRGSGFVNSELLYTYICMYINIRLFIMRTYHYDTYVFQYLYVCI